MYSICSPAVTRQHTLLKVRLFGLFLFAFLPSLHCRKQQSCAHITIIPLQSLIVRTGEKDPSHWFEVKKKRGKNKQCPFYLCAGRVRAVEPVGWILIVHVVG